MVDSHCHLADDAFASDLDAVITRARLAGLAGALCIVDVSDAGEQARVEGICASWDAVRTTAGVHPHRALEFAGAPARARDAVAARLAVDPRARAIGEIGLDYHYDFAPRDVQRAVFEAQVVLARECGLPIVVHTRKADEDTVRILEDAGRGEVRGVFHCFSGGPELAGRAVALGFHVSFSGILTFPSAGRIREAAAAVPEDRLLVETDSPYLAPVPLRGRRNEPAYVLHVARSLADIRGIPESRCLALTTLNYRVLFEP